MTSTYLPGGPVFGTNGATAQRSPEAGKQAVTRGIRYFPIVAAEVYLSASALLFAFGPWPWAVESPYLLYCFLFFAQASLALGYWKGTRVRQAHRSASRVAVLRLIRISLFVNCLWIFPKFIVRAGLSDFSPQAVLQQIWFGLSDPNGAHVAMATSVGNSKIALAYALFTPVLYLSLPLTIHYWHIASKRDKTILVLVAAADALTWMATGTSKGVVDAAIVIAASIMPEAVFRWTRSGLRQKVKYGAIAALCIIVGAGFFLQMQFARRRRKHFPRRSPLQHVDGRGQFPRARPLARVQSGRRLFSKLPEPGVFCA